jgi:hypothetical protein
MRPGVEVTDMAARIREHAATVDASLRLSEFRWLGDNNAQQRADGRGRADGRVRSGAL